MTYMTIQGDMWDRIAVRILGDEKFKPALMRANPKHISTYIFPGGVELTIPELDESTYDGTLPPWKQVTG